MATIVENFSQTVAKDGSYRIHRATCKRMSASAEPLEADAYHGGSKNYLPATCCKPRVEQVWDDVAAALAADASEPEQRSEHAVVPVPGARYYLPVLCAGVADLCASLGMDLVPEPQARQALVTGDGAPAAADLVGQVMGQAMAAFKAYGGFAKMEGETHGQRFKAAEQWLLDYLVAWNAGWCHQPLQPGARIGAVRGWRDGDQFAKDQVAAVI